jgi:hypothetical protein
MYIDGLYYGAICGKQTDFSSPSSGGRGGREYNLNKVHTCKYHFKGQFNGKTRAAGSREMTQNLAFKGARYE